MNKIETKGLVVCLVEHMTDEQARAAAEAASELEQDSRPTDKKRNVQRFVEDPMTGYSYRGVYLN